MIQSAPTTHYENATNQDGDALAEIRAQAMQPSLEAVGRFDANSLLIPLYALTQQHPAAHGDKQSARDF